MAKVLVARKEVRDVEKIGVMRQVFSNEEVSKCALMVHLGL